MEQCRIFRSSAQFEVVICPTSYPSDAPVLHLSDVSRTYREYDYQIPLLRLDSGPWCGTPIPADRNLVFRYLLSTYETRRGRWNLKVNRGHLR